MQGEYEQAAQREETVGTSGQLGLYLQQTFVKHQTETHESHFLHIFCLLFGACLKIQHVSFLVRTVTCGIWPVDSDLTVVV